MNTVVSSAMPPVSNASRFTTGLVGACALLCAVAAGTPAQAAVVKTFDDEFTSFSWSPDGSNGWMTTFPWSGLRTLSGNYEAEFYSDASVGVNPFSLYQGKLSITAAPTDPSTNWYNQPYTSGLITTYKSFSQLYGIFQVRAQLPAGRGLWPAFWLLPANGQYTSELDVFEVLENAPNVLYSTTHGSTDDSWASDCQQLQVPDTADGYHIYSVDWEPRTITFRIDGVVTATAATPASMNTPMFILLNLAVGGQGSWPGAPDATTPFPAVMKIDWVRAYATKNTVQVSGTRAITQ